jgi:hypothetical protein
MAWTHLFVNPLSFLHANLSHIAQDNIFSLGYWDITDPQHPEYKTLSCTPSHTRFGYDPSGLSSSSGFSTVSAHTAQSVSSIHNPNSPVVQTPPLSIDAAAILFSSKAPPDNTPIQPPSPPDVNMSVNATTTTGTAPSNGLKGIVPAVFIRDCLHLDTFWNKFHQYHLLN